MQKVVSDANAMVKGKHLIASLIKYKAFLANFQPFSLTHPGRFSFDFCSVNCVPEIETKSSLKFRLQQRIFL